MGGQSAPITTYLYDVFIRVSRITDPNSGLTDFTYDDAGDLLTLTDPEENVTSYAYGGLNRVYEEKTKKRFQEPKKR